MSIPLPVEDREFRIGDAVEVVAPTPCPVVDLAVAAGRWHGRLAITGYSGVVADLQHANDGQLLVTLEWDAETLGRTSDAWKRFWASAYDGGTGFGYVTLPAWRLRHIPPGDNRVVRYKARREMESRLRAMKVMEDICRTAGFTTAQFEAGRIHATLFRYEPDHRGALRIREFDGIDPLYQLVAKHDLGYTAGTLRVGSRMVGLPRTARAMDQVRRSGREAIRVIFEWFEKGTLQEMEVVVDVRPRVLVSGITPASLAS